MTDTNVIQDQIEVLQSILDPYKEFLAAREAHEKANTHTVTIGGEKHRVPLVVDVAAAERFEAASAAYAEKRTFLRQCREYLDAVAGDEPQPVEVVTDVTEGDDV